MLDKYHFCNMKQFIKEWAGLIIALLLAIVIALHVFNSWMKVQVIKELTNNYVELIQEAINYENNKQN